MGKVEKIKFNYNLHYLLESELTLDSDNKLISEIKYSYDKNRNVIGIQNSTLNRLWEYQYIKFDKENNWIERKRLLNGNLFSIEKRSINYW